MARPEYFERVRKRAAAEWDQLEANPSLAGPWHQLFKQVQSPRHILSELLQNADDAGATEAEAKVENDRFVFSHNGEDFKEEHFASLCRFGYSNKRALHTIGFRGVGFKSTFSLGGRVELATPTLSVAFDKRRFTEPEWVARPPGSTSKTTVAVQIRDAHRRIDVERNFAEWLQSPTSLLFFRSLRRLRISGREIHWVKLGPGPAPDTEWVALEDAREVKFLLARSAEVSFPAEALNEINDERLLGSDDPSDFPPSRVEIVLGFPGRLYVVLPTGVQTELPFACNGPFIQDPARVKIKDPATSPTNRWLLQRTGDLAATVMLRWLENGALELEDRSRAYGLMPDVDRDATSIEGICAAAVEIAFDNTLSGRAYVLADSGKLFAKGGCVSLPPEILEAWPEAPKVFDPQQRPPLSSHVLSRDRAKLTNWLAVEDIGKTEIIAVLRAKSLSRPKTWAGLVSLWSYVSQEVTGHWSREQHADLQIVPVQGTDNLHSAQDVARLSDKKLLQSDEDWRFLSKRLLVLNPNWPRYLAEQRRLTEDSVREAQKPVLAALEVQRVLGLSEATNVDEVVQKVARAFFAEKPDLKSCVQFSQIAAKLDATSNGTFRYVSRDEHLRSDSDMLISDQDGLLEDLLPDSWAAEHVIHSAYTQRFSSCSAEEWRSWVLSGGSGLDALPALVEREESVYRDRFEEIMRSLGYHGPLQYPYQSANWYSTQSYVVRNFDFPEELTGYWEDLPTEDNPWPHLASLVLAAPESFWRNKGQVVAAQTSSGGQSIQALRLSGVLPAAWVRRFQERACLRDTKGVLRKPPDVLRRTAATEPFMDVEPFIAGQLDSERSAALLTLLGVRDTPIDSNALLDRLRAIAKAESPPVQEVDKWYRRLDQVLATATAETVASVREAFRTEKLIFTDFGWDTSSAVFLDADEDDAPGLPVIRKDVRELSLWRRIGVSERPNTDLAIEWLKQLPRGGLSRENERRVVALQKRYPVRIWLEVGHWINLAREWVPVAELKYALTMQSLVEWSHLHDAVKRRTADLRLSTDVVAAPPFSGLASLSSSIEERLTASLHTGPSPEVLPWLAQLGRDLGRMEIDDAEEQRRIRELANRLAESTCIFQSDVAVIPYIAGVPSGTARVVDVAWIGTELRITKLPAARLAKVVPERIGRVFGRADVVAALNYSFARSPSEVSEYMEENFRLGRRSEQLAPETPQESDTQADKAEALEELQGGGAPKASEPPESARPDEAEDQTKPNELDRLLAPALEPGPRTAPRNATPRALPIAERFATARGYRRVDDSMFLHPDGRKITKSPEGVFPWKQLSVTGEVERNYWMRDHCLERGALELPADVWDLLDRPGDAYALVLLTSGQEPVEILGSHLVEMRDSGQLSLYPAAYRIVAHSL